MQTDKGGMPNLVGGISQQPAELRRDNQCDYIANAVCSVTDGLSVRTPFRVAGEMMLGEAMASGSSFPSTPFVHSFTDGSDNDLALVLWRLPSGGMKAFVLQMESDGSCEIYNVTGEMDGGFDPLSYLSSTTPQQSIRAVSVQDTTWLVNRDVVITGANVAEATPANMAIVFWRGSGFGQKYTLTLNIAGTDYVWGYEIVNTPLQSPITEWAMTTNYAADVMYGVMTGGSYRNETHDMTPNGTDVADPKTYLNTIVATTVSGTSLASLGVTIIKEGSRLILTGPASMKVTVQDGRGGDYMKLAHKAINKDSDLPAKGYDGFIIKVEGEPGSTADDYWLKYSTADGWQQTYEPGKRYRYNRQTTPMLLIKDGSDYVIKVNQLEDRLIGDDKTNKTASFLGTNIQDISFYKNRLVLITSTTLVTSEIGFYENFFRTSLSELKDTDRIDAEVAFPNYFNLEHIITFDKQLFLMSPSAQFIVSGEPLSIKTVATTAISKYRYDPRLQPIVTEQSIYWIASDHGSDRLFQFIPFADRAGGYTADDVTEHCPEILGTNAKGVRSHVVFPGLRMAFFIASFGIGTKFNSSSFMRVYQWYDQNFERLQSAWGEWGLRDVYPVALLKSKFGLWMLGCPRKFAGVVGGINQEQWDWERMLIHSNDLRKNAPDTVPSDGFQFKLDRSIVFTAGVSNVPGASMAYVGGRTVWTLPYEYDPRKTGLSGISVVTVSTGGGGGRGTVLNGLQFDSANKVSVAGYYPDVVVGLPYSMKVVLPTFFPKNQGGAKNSGFNLQIRTLTVSYGVLDSCYMDARETHRNGIVHRDLNRYVSSGNIGMPSPARITKGWKGSIRYQIGMRAEAAKITFEMAGQGQGSITSIDWDGILKAV